MIENGTAEARAHLGKWIMGSGGTRSRSSSPDHRARLTMERAASANAAVSPASLFANPDDTSYLINHALASGMHDLTCDPSAESHAQCPITF
ncbi:hypothetical protein NMY22_g19823 [Coprinellus aureogranulatus]|nr:hypothetical protein NMY22_g19823 [Coprinellus aureogranulatus]